MTHSHCLVMSTCIIYHRCTHALTSSEDTGHFDNSSFLTLHIPSALCNFCWICKLLKHVKYLSHFRLLVTYQVHLQGLNWRPADLRVQQKRNARPSSSRVSKRPCISSCIASRTTGEETKSILTGSVKWDVSAGQRKRCPSVHAPFRYAHQKQKQKESK